MYIKKIAYAREASLSDSNEYVRIPRKNKFKTVVLRSNKSPKKAHRHHGIERYFVLCKRQEFLSASTRRIVSRIALAFAPTVLSKI